ncbi:MAG TPA: putative toxin-antitoxin system toxin component, PIN family, partial [Leptospiraceae bacterium]|nr:putative toxin-antitoxin system toxin component, PIN family [Leptospiraceae bacterium]
PKLKNYFPEDVIADLLLFFSEKCTLVAIQRIVQECNDPEDNYILDIGIQHNLNYIITGDSDLLSMHPFHKLSILKIQNFLHLIE